MLKDSSLLIKFWDEVIKADVYTRNYIFNSPKINGIRQILISAYIGKMSNINHLKLFGYKCYKYIDSKSLSANRRIDKLIILGQLGVFIKYSKETIK
jgi:hypothetical protein